MRFPGLEVVATNLENLAIRILRILEDRTRRTIDRKVDVATVRRKRRLTEFFLVLLARLLDDDNTATTITMIEPDLTGPQ